MSIELTFNFIDYAFGSLSTGDKAGGIRGKSHVPSVFDAARIVTNRRNTGWIWRFLCDLQFLLARRGRAGARPAGRSAGP